MNIIFQIDPPLGFGSKCPGNLSLVLVNFEKIARYEFGNSELQRVPFDQDTHINKTLVLLMNDCGYGSF
jgi:hypothetical protein